MHRPGPAVNGGTQPGGAAQPPVGPRQGGGGSTLGGAPPPGRAPPGANGTPRPPSPGAAPVGNFGARPLPGPPAGGPGPAAPSFGGLPPGGMRPPAQARPSAAAQSRIDPSQIPHPRNAEAQLAALEPEVFETRVDGAPNQPPTSTSNFIAVDRGNCSPRYMRLTLGTVPCSGDLARNCRMPFALSVQPLALPHPEEELLQVVDFGPSGPIRCGRCEAYLNPFMKFIDGGRRFKCNFC